MIGTKFYHSQGEYYSLGEVTVISHPYSCTKQSTERHSTNGTYKAGSPSKTCVVVEFFGYSDRFEKRCLQIIEVSIEDLHPIEKPKPNRFLGI